MVAGSRTGSARREAGGALPVFAPRVGARPAPLTLDRARGWPTFAGLYVFAVLALLLPWPFGPRPGWAYNWEGYTAWHWQTFWERPLGPSLAILAPTDGLMTDSGQGPLVGLPVSLGIGLAGFTIEAMRIPVALVAALAAPLLWMLGRRVAGPGPAVLAALLLAMSPAFLFYGRTATLVGISLVPLLLMGLALARVLAPGGEEQWRWSREGVLVGSLLLGIMSYAPVRLFWPLAVVMLGFGALENRKRRKSLLITALVAAIVVPVAVMALEMLTSPDPRPVAAAAGYFHARGEQLMAMGHDPAAASQYVRQVGPEERAGWLAARHLVGQNAADLGQLLLDRDTLPVPTDYWNERGRFWFGFLLPFALVGAMMAVSAGRRGGGGAAPRLLPLVTALGLALPLLLTSRVHVGRLLPALPFAILLTATGVWICADWLTALARWAGAARFVSSRIVAASLAGALLIPVFAGARAEMSTPIAQTREALTAATIAGWVETARERGDAILVEDPALGDDIERVHAATYRLDLERSFRFVDLKAGPSAVADGRPALVWRGALGALQAGEIAAPCDRLWFVGPEVAGDFFAAWRATGCPGVPDTVILP